MYAYPISATELPVYRALRKTATVRISLLSMRIANFCYYAGVYGNISDDERKKNPNRLKIIEKLISLFVTFNNVRCG